MATPLPPQAPTPDQHIGELVTLAEHYEKAAAHFGRAGVESHPTTIRGLYERRAAAIRWILAVTAHGVDESEIVS